jgi:hypothetical protein
LAHTAWTSSTSKKDRVEFGFGSNAANKPVMRSGLAMNENGKRRSAQSLLAKLHQDERPKLRSILFALACARARFAMS